MIIALNLSCNNFNKCEILNNRCMTKSALAQIDKETDFDNTLKDRNALTKVFLN